MWVSGPPNPMIPMWAPLAHDGREPHAEFGGLGHGGVVRSGPTVAAGELEADVDRDQLGSSNPLRCRWLSAARPDDRG